MAHHVLRTDKADELIHKIILYVAERFGNEVALKKLDEVEAALSSLGDYPYKGVQPRYALLRRQGYLVLVLEKDLVFYKVNEREKAVIIYAVVDQRQDYMSIIRGL